VRFMSKTKFTKAEVRRAVEGVIEGGGKFDALEIRPDGSMLVTSVTLPGPLIDAEDDPEVSRKLL
jgi:hypothetical protein